MIAHEALRLQSQKFIEALRSGEFFEAHEHLEALWFVHRHSKAEEILLLRSYINAAVSFELQKRQREESAQRVWGNFLKRRPLLETVANPNRALYEEMERAILNHNKEKSI